MGRTPPPVTRASPGFLEEVVRHVADPIFVKDSTFRFTWVNDALCDLVGVAREELLGKTDHDFFPTSQADFFRLKDQEVMETGQTVTIEEEPITDARAQQHVLATTKVPLRAPDGAITHIVGIIHDITRLKVVEEELRLSNDDLERRVEERTRALRDAQNALLRKERLAVLGQLSGGLAHQIRTPLTTIGNAVAVLRRKLAGSTDEDLKTALSIVDEEIWEANRIITDLLDFARVRPPSAASVPVQLVIDAALDGALAAAHAPDGIAVERSVPTDLVAWVDERQTRDALGNVIRNALEAMGDEGRLTVRAAADPPFAAIAVEDTGPGLSPEALVHLFEPLVTTKSLGLGLGLTTARALIENQGGDIRYAARPEGGARFEIRVPLQEEVVTSAPSGEG